ncbi:hypothetical protein [Streptomyces alkaliphilus]|uniref:hypothetical protein n=1 Tax=Streptomyces alkaliphilus TaxID=1472722 RepID=UPI00117C78EB|nr:hypothetical protein [Streptomyces alkaliphilus]MQS06099.1 hypothetical protein [Streptomyces alkaliphilus]
MTGYAIPLVVLLGVVSLLLVRGRDVRTWEAVVIGLFGFHLALTPVGDVVSAAVVWLLGAFFPIS